MAFYNMAPFNGLCSTLKLTVAVTEPFSWVITAPYSFIIAQPKTDDRQALYHVPLFCQHWKSVFARKTP